MLAADPATARRARLVGIFGTAYEPGPQPAVVYALGPVGSGHSAWIGLRQELGDELEVRPIRLPGRESRFVEPPLTSVADQVAHIADELAPLVRVDTRPYLLVGVCSGAITSYEVACALTATDVRAPHRLVAVSQPAPEAVAPPDVRHTLTGAAFRRWMLAEIWLPDEVVDDTALELFEPAIRADLQALETYVPRTRPGTGCDIVALFGRRDELDPGAVRRWAEFTRGRFTMVEVEGDHHLLMSAPHLLASALRALIREQI